MPGFSDSVKASSGVKFDHFYYHYNGERKETNASGSTLYKSYYLIKFYPNGKLGYLSAGLSGSLDSIDLYNRRLKPEGYQWGYYFIKSDTVYMEVRTRNEPYYFWVGKIEGNKIHVIYDYKQTLIPKTDSFTLEYKY